MRACPERAERISGFWLSARWSTTPLKLLLARELRRWHTSLGYVVEVVPSLSTGSAHLRGQAITLGFTEKPKKLRAGSPSDRVVRFQPDVGNTNWLVRAAPDAARSASRYPASVFTTFVGNGKAQMALARTCAPDEKSRLRGQPLARLPPRDVIRLAQALFDRLLPNWPQANE